MTRELAMVHAREGIRVNSICPYVCRNPAPSQQMLILSLPFFLLLSSSLSGPLKTRE